MTRPLLFLSLLFALGPSYGADLLAGQAWYLQKPAEGDATLATVPAEGAPGGHRTALRITVVKPSDPFYQILLGQTVAPAVPENTRLRLRFWGRSPTRSPVRAVVEENSAPYNSVTEQTPILTPDWKEYTITGTVSPAYGPNGLGVKFQVGQQAGVVELAGITLEDLGPDPAYLAAQAAVAPAAEQSRIRRCRMNDLTVLVRDKNGRPVPGARVHVAQTRHAFLFGCNFFALNPADNSPLETAYRDEFTALFNYATLPFYWGAFESRQGRPDYARLDAMAQWSVAHGVTPKGHPLVWHEVWPRWAPTDPDASIPLLHQRVTDLVTHYQGVIHYWDVVNEANSPDPKTGEGAWIKRDGAATVVGTALDWARAAGRGADDTFLYNDYNTGPQNVALLTQLQKRGKLPDAIGLQSHMHGGVWPLTKVWQTCQTFAQFGLPIHFTETTVISGPRRAHDVSGPAATNWNTTPEGEAAQADYVAQFYTLLFSHPSVRAITWWDFSDLNAWQGAPAGLVRKDMTPKPAYTRLMQLIHHDWWTDSQGRADHLGRYQVHAFYGDYKITATDSHGHTVTQTVSWPEASGPRQVTVTL
ncbi:MAG: endo-1,4-beta-xylanase [Armatimonadetes bacterium]|nr:endo-1,4-beta-xylanase [Armatimonadota bacterium]